MTRSTRAPRSDAERNRARVLEAAAGLLAERGTEVGIAEVARAAGVGAGTVYRHFGSKEELTTAVALMRLRALTAAVQAVTDPDPAACLTKRLATIFEGLLEDRGLLIAVGDRLTASEEHPAVRRALLLVLEEALTAAQDAGAVRADVTEADLLSLVGRLAAQSQTTFNQARRHFVLALDALRPGGTRPLPPSLDLPG